MAKTQQRDLREFMRRNARYWSRDHTRMKAWVSMGKGLLGPNGGSGGKFEGKFGEHCGGNGGIGGSMSGVGEGIDESMGGMGGGSLARPQMWSMMDRRMRIVVCVRRSSRELRKA
ncbi:hypothetical protein Tco_1263347 [Tanacetum coccineum]